MTSKDFGKLYEEYLQLYSELKIKDKKIGSIQEAERIYLNCLYKQQFFKVSKGQTEKFPSSGLCNFLENTLKLTYGRTTYSERDQHELIGDVGKLFYLSAEDCRGEIYWLLCSIRVKLKNKDIRCLAKDLFPVLWYYLDISMEGENHDTMAKKNTKAT